MEDEEEEEEEMEDMLEEKGVEILGEEDRIYEDGEKLDEKDSGREDSGMELGEGEEGSQIKTVSKFNLINFICKYSSQLSLGCHLLST